MDRQALTAERDSLLRKRKVREESSSPHEAAIAMINDRLAEIDAQLAAPEIVIDPAS